MTKIQDQALFPRLLNRNRQWINYCWRRENFSDTFQTKELANGALNKIRFLKCRIINRSNKRRWNLEQRQLVTKLNSVKNKARRVNFPSKLNRFTQSASDRNMNVTRFYFIARQLNLYERELRI